MIWQIQCQNGLSLVVEADDTLIDQLSLAVQQRVPDVLVLGTAMVRFDQILIIQPARRRNAWLVRSVSSRVRKLRHYAAESLKALLASIRG